MRQETIALMVDEYLSANHFVDQIKGKDGKVSYSRTLYADYDDTIGDSTLKEILSAGDPYQEFYDKMEEWFLDARLDDENRLFDEVLDKCFHNDLSDEDKDYLRDYLREVFEIDTPTDHFLKQPVCINIMMDTGDGNLDFVSNSSVSPCWYGGDNHIIDPRASLLWLSKTQGYNKTQLQNALKEGDMDNPHGFLNTCRVEVANLSSHMSTVTFLVKMTLDQALLLNRLIGFQDRDGRHYYDTRFNPNCGSLVVGKETEVGLYDPWSGAGSLLEIQLEKDVRIPIKYIWTALPDGGQGYAIKSVYGTNDSLWKETVKKFQIPRELKTLI